MTPNIVRTQHYVFTGADGRVYAETFGPGRHEIVPTPWASVAAALTWMDATAAEDGAWIDLLEYAGDILGARAMAAGMVRCSGQLSGDACEVHGVALGTGR